MFAFSFQPWGNILLWLAVVVIAIIVEIETLQIVSIWFAASGLVTMILAAFNCPIEIQIIVFVVLSVILFLCSRPIVKKINRSKSENSTIESMIGEEVVVIKEIKVGEIGEIKAKYERYSAIAPSEKNDIPVARIHNASVNALKSVLEQYCTA